MSEGANDDDRWDSTAQWHYLSATTLGIASLQSSHLGHAHRNVLLAATFWFSLALQSGHIVIRTTQSMFDMAIIERLSSCNNISRALPVFLQALLGQAGQANRQAVRFNLPTSWEVHTMGSPNKYPLHEKPISLLTRIYWHVRETKGWVGASKHPKRYPMTFIIVFNGGCAVH